MRQFTLRLMLPVTVARTVRLPTSRWDDLAHTQWTMDAAHVVSPTIILDASATHQEMLVDTETRRCYKRAFPPFPAPLNKCVPPTHVGSKGGSDAAAFLSLCSAS